MFLTGKKKYWIGSAAALLVLIIAVLFSPGFGKTRYVPQTVGSQIQQTGTGFASGSFDGARLADSGGTHADDSLHADVITLEPAASEGTYTSEPQKTDFPFNAVDIHWVSDETPGSRLEVEVRFSEDGSNWGEWKPAEYDELEAPDFAAERSRATSEKFSQLIFVEKARYLQYRLIITGDARGVAPKVREVTATYIDSKGLHEGPVSIGRIAGEISAFIRPPAAGADPNIITRAQWGANESWMTWTPQYSTPRKQIVHHTVTANNDPDPAATVRAIYYDHALIRDGGWGDIGYNYLVDAQGRVYEGRYGGNGVIGGHALGWNTGTIGISTLGNYDVADITGPLFWSVVDLMAAKSNLNHIDPWGVSSMNGAVTPNYLGHRDTYATACPGGYLYQHMNHIRDEAYTRYSQVPVIGAIKGKWDALGGSPGSPVNAEYAVTSAGGQWLGQAQDFANGRLIWDQAAGGVYWIHGAILGKYDQLGRESGFLGMPRSDEYGVAEGRGHDFAGGKIYWSPATGAGSVRGAIMAKLISDGGVVRDGFPISDEYDVTGKPGARSSTFQRARIYWTESGGTHTVCGGIMMRYVLLGGPQAFGLPVSDEYDTPGFTGGRQSDFTNGRIYWSPGTGANGVTGAILGKYLTMGGPASGYGLPSDNEFAASNGRAQNLQGAVLTWENSIGTHVVYGGIMGKYRQMGGPAGYLGLATSDESDVPGYSGARVSEFQNGRIYWQASAGVHSVVGAINMLYGQLGGPALIGMPVSDEHDVFGVPGGRESDFQGGRIFYHPTAGTHEVYGGILAKYLAYGGPSGYLGMPVSGEMDVSGVSGARESRFQGGRVYWSAGTGSQAVVAGILGKYLEYGGPASALGMPVSDEYDFASGRRSDFQGGYIYWSAALGAVVYTGTPTTLTADTAYEVRDGNGTLLAAPGAGQVTTVRYANGIYTVQAPGVFHSGNSFIRVTAAGGIVQVTSYHDRPSWNPSLDDNKFRGAIEVRYSPASGALWVVNDLPLEDYLRGIAESSSGSPGAFLRTMATAARTYALWHLDRGGKHGSNEIFHLKNSRNGNGDDQQYKGYGLESRFPDLSTAVNNTFGMVVTYGGQVAMTPYYSNSDGRTRSAQEAWGVTYWPWLQSVPDPDCNGMAMNGHGVGLSGVGALARAGRGDTYQSILTYYYTGTSVQAVNTSRNIRIAIVRVS